MLAIVRRLIAYPSVAKRLIKSLISAIVVCELRIEAGLKEERTQAQYYASASAPALTPEQRGQIISSTHLPTLFENCITQRWDDLLTTISLNIIAESRSIPVT